MDKDITITALLERQGADCRICGQVVDINDYHTDEHGNFIVGATYPSIDHIKPVSLGGTHTWDNVQLTHHRCNTIKNDNEVYVANGQLVFAI